MKLVNTIPMKQPIQLVSTKIELSLLALDTFVALSSVNMSPGPDLVSLLSWSPPIGPKLQNNFFY